MSDSKALSMIGMATRAGRMAGGESAAEKAIRSGEAVLVIVAEDASGNTKKKFRNMCAWRDIPLCFFEKKEALGRATGRGLRSVLVVEDRGFADAIEKKIRTERQNAGSEE